MGLGTATYFVIAVLSPLMVRDLGLSRSQLGILPTLIYGLGAVLSPWGGSLSDRFGGRSLLMSLFAATALGLAVLSLAGTYAVVIVGATITGIGTAITNPGTNQVIATHVRLERRGLVTGVKQSGTQIGGLIIGLTLPAVAVAVGWRGGAALVAATALLMVIITAVVMPTEPRVEAAASTSLPTTDIALPRDTTARWIAAYGLFMGAGTSSVGVYLPLYVVEGLGRSVVLGGMTTSLLAALGIAARIFAGARLGGLRHPARGLMLTAATAAAGALCMLTSAWYGWPWLGLGLLCMGVSTTTWMIIAVLAILDAVPPEQAGKASGVMQLSFYGGFAVSPAVIGLIIDRTGSYAAAWQAVASIFAMALVVATAWARAARRTPVDGGGPLR